MGRLDIVASADKSPNFLSATAAAQEVDEGRAVILDVRQRSEYRLDGQVPGSVNVPAFDWEHGFHLPRGGFTEEVSALGFDQLLLIVACADGRLSQGAASTLLADGTVAHVAVLEGGLWS